MRRIRNELRYLLTRSFLLIMGLRVGYWRRQVEYLWLCTEEHRKAAQERLLMQNRPLNTLGSAITNLRDLSVSPPLSKQRLRSISKSNHEVHARKFGRHTAGTTGESTFISVNPEELGRMLGVRDYCFRRIGLRLGEREARLWARPDKGLKNYLKNLFLNRRVFHPVDSQPELEVRKLLEWDPEYIYGYSSLLLEAAKIIQHFNIEFSPPKCIICTAEGILPVQKEYLSRVFRAPVVEEYGSTEFDVIAFECPKGHRHLVNPWLIIEDLPTGCLISDCSRQSLDIIRYELGDVLSIENTNCLQLGSIFAVSSLEGRSVNQFAYVNSDIKFHAVHFGNLSNQYMNDNADVFRVKVIQLEIGFFEVVVMPTPRKGLLDFKEFIEEYIKKEIGYEIHVTCTDVDRFPDSKRSYFINKLSA